MADNPLRVSDEHGEAYAVQVPSNKKERDKLLSRLSQRTAAARKVSGEKFPTLIRRGEKAWIVRSEAARKAIESKHPRTRGTSGPSLEDMFAQADAKAKQR